MLTSLNSYLKSKNAKFIWWNDQNIDVLITGMMRVSGKTYKIFDFILYNFPNKKILYVTRIVGKTKKGEEKGTFSDTEKTIRKIEKERGLPNRRIAMVAGKEKICLKISSFRPKNKAEEISKLFICQDCNRRSKKLPIKLRNELARVATLTPAISSAFAEQYDVCPRSIIRYYVDNLADIVFITYAMLKYREIKDDYDFIVWDEARYLMDANVQHEKEIANLQSDEKPNYKIWEKTLFEQFLPNFFDFKKIPDWYKPIDGYVYCMWNVLKSKVITKTGIDEIKRIHPRSLDGIDRGFLPKIFYIEEWEKFKSEYVHFLKVPGVTPDTPDSDIQSLNRDTVRKKLHGLVDSYQKNKIPSSDKKEALKAMTALHTLYSIAGSKRVEVEILEKPHLKKPDEYHLIIKGYTEKRLPRGKLNFYIDGTPYPSSDFHYWLGVKPNIVLLPSDVEVRIVYEDAKKPFGDVYGHGDKSPGFKSTVKLINGIKEGLKGRKVAIVARNKEVAKMLGSNGIPISIVCGDIESEGVQLDSDAIILEGTQIKNLNAGKSKKFDLARAKRLLKPDPVHQIQQLTENCQVMIQSAFRGIDRTGNRLNLIVLLGNKMYPPVKDGNKTYRRWIELAQKWFPYLREDNVKIVGIDGNLLIENKIAEIVEVANPNHDFSLSPLDNLILEYLRQRSKGTKAESIRKDLKRTQKDIYESLRRLVGKNKVSARKGIYKIT